LTLSPTSLAKDFAPATRADHAYSLGYVVVGICALAAAALALLAIGGTGGATLMNEESLAEDA